MEWDQKTSILVRVHDLYPHQVPTNGQAEKNDLKSRDEELENEEARVAVNSHQVLPAESSDVDRTREAGERIPGAFARSDERRSIFGS